MIGKKKILGVGITDATKNEVLEYVIKNLEKFKKKLFIVTPNPEILVLANKDDAFKNVLNSADLASPDGMGVLVAGRFLGKPLKERFTGVDLVESLCSRVAEKPITVGFFGGRDNVAVATAECLQKRYPGLRVVFAGKEWPNDDFFNHLRASNGTLLQNYGNKSSLSKNRQQSNTNLTVNSSVSSQSSPLNAKYILPAAGIDILFVALGAPKQEFWISEHLDKIPVRVAVGVGGAFDYISGRIPRAPGFMRSVGLEWLFRLVVQPWRIKRQLSLVEFVWLVLEEKMAGKRLVK